jgi:hypothetical protein
MKKHVAVEANKHISKTPEKSNSSGVFYMIGLAPTTTAATATVVIF